MTDIARPDVKPAFAERNIPIALSTDENYLPYVKVVVNSILSCTKSGNIDILILHNGIPPQEIELFLVDFAGVQNASVRFVNIKKFVESTELSKFDQKRYLSAAACYRLLLPDVLEAYDKLIYLDVDTVVCHDLGELYATDLADNMFGAVIDVVNSSSKPDYAEWARGYGFVEWDEYVNTGVMLFNLARFRCASILDKLMPIAIEASKWFCDQDALNFVCKGQIVHLDPRWNVQVGDYCLKEQIALTGDEMWIMHFTGLQKPWKLPARRYSHFWWRYVDASDVSPLWTQAWGDALVLPAAGTPKLSVVVPVYNADRYLSEALASVLCQKEMPEIEVICVDDGSTDDSAEILEFWKNRDSRLRILRQKNHGPGVARNAGMDIAKGEYICFLDADDRLSSGTALRQAYEQARADDLDILLADGSFMSEDGTIERREACLVRSVAPDAPVFAPDALGAKLYMITPMGPGGKLFRRKFIEDKNLRFPALRRSEDFPMIQLALSLAERIGVMAQPLFCRRIGVATSLESTKDDTPLIFAEAERIFRRLLSEHGLQERFARAADVSLLHNLAYNLRKVRQFSSFKAIARYCADIVPACTLKGGEVRAAFRSRDAADLVSKVAAVADDQDGLAQAFADLHPKISIIIPIYNQEALLPECLDSIRKQTHLDIEIICVDDGSTDNSRAVAEKYARRDEWLATAKKNTERAEAKLAAEKAKVEALNAKIARRDEWLAAAKKNAERAEAKRAAAEAKVEALNAKIARRDEWLAAEKKNAERVEAKRAAAEAKVEALNAKIARRDEWLVAEKKNAERAEAKRAAAEAKVEALNAKLARRDEWLAELKTKKTLAEKKLAEALKVCAQAVQSMV